jgi:2-oxoglutarate ferredoxin oxidoreductase subunit delta
MPKVVVLQEYCKSCGLCVNICPKGVLAIGDKANQKGYYPVVVTDEEKCISCALCGTVCPDLALEIWREERK